jgi:hypothetical protein
MILSHLKAELGLPNQRAAALAAHRQHFELLRAVDDHFQFMPYSESIYNALINTTETMNGSFPF